VSIVDCLDPKPQFIRPIDKARHLPLPKLFLWRVPLTRRETPVPATTAIFPRSRRA
jgi:hypothetical protein